MSRRLLTPKARGCAGRPPGWPMSQQEPSLSDFVRHAQSSDAHQPNLNAEFKKLKLSKAAAASSLLEDAAAALDVDTPEGCFANTVALANVLNAMPMTQDLYPRACAFLTACNAEHTADCDDAFDGLCRKLANHAIEVGGAVPLQTVKFLYTAVQKRIRDDWSMLSPVHTDLLQVLIAAKLYGMATQVADCSPIHICKRADAVGADKHGIALDAQRFFYYAGIAYAAMRDYESSTRALLTGLSLPALAFGAVHLALYKKLVLVSLLHRGRVDALPRYLSNAVSKNLDHLQQHRSGDVFPYTQVAKAFEEASTDAAGMLKLANHAQFAEDGNAGLVEAVVAAYKRKKVARLTSVYLTLSLEKIRGVAGEADVQAAERGVLDMIRNGHVNAAIDQRLGVVHFLSAVAVRNVDAELEQLSAFAALLANADDRLATDKSFIQKLVQRSAPGAAAASASVSEFMELER